jgi:hypothetical protein
VQAGVKTMHHAEINTANAIGLHFVDHKSYLWNFARARNSNDLLVSSSNMIFTRGYFMLGIESMSSK